jgi:ATP-binding cassette, subfamily B, bacterial
MKDVIAGLWSAVWQYRRRTALALVLLVVAKIAAVAVPMVLKAVVDHFSGEREQNAAAAAGHLNLQLTLPVFLLLGYALMRFASTLFTELRDLVFARVTLRTVAAFAQRVFGHLLALSPRFHTGRNTGVLIRDVERGTAGIGFLLGAGLFTVLPTLIEFSAVLVVMSVAGYSGWFTLAIAVTFFAYAGYTGVMSRRRERHQREVNEIDSSAHGRLVDSLLNVEMVGTHARQGYELQRYDEIRSRLVAAGLRNQRALSALHIGQSAVIAAGVATVMLLAGQQTLTGRMSVGDLILVNAYVIQLCMPLNTLGFVFRQTMDALVDTEKLFALLRAAPEIQDKPGAKALALAGGEVVFEHVAFAYEPGRPILADFSLHVPAGRTVAVVGGSGSGKSTLGRLLLRLYDPDAGRITIDGQDLRLVQVDSLHEAIGVVSQDTAMFNDTLAHNIGYGRLGAGMGDIVAAAQAAQVHEFIQSLPLQYDTLVGERGMKLSGGEKQRVAIARAILKNPPILIFDEATSALDTRAERAIQTELDRIAQGRTTLIIAHRLSTIVHADNIVVMDRGRIVESGRHDALLAREGLYAQLWNLQLQQREFERAERRLARQPLNLGVLLAGVIDAMRGTIESRGILLYTDIDMDNAAVSGDAGLLSSALHDIVRQALGATPPGGRIEIRLERRDASARLTVADGRHRGPPQPGADVDDGLADRHPPYDPLELRSMIERMGGEFAIEAADGHHGLRSIVELPLQPLMVAAPPAPGMAAPDRSAAPGRLLEGLRVMCIDDHEDALLALQTLLQLDGAAVTPFRSGAAALVWLAAHGADEWPDLLACDISLGADQDGYAVMQRIRQMEAERRVPLDRRLPSIALTGHARQQDRLTALMAGFQLHLAKPVDPALLARSLAALAGRSAPATPENGAPPPQANGKSAG